MIQLHGLYEKYREQNARHNYIPTHHLHVALETLEYERHILLPQSTIEPDESDSRSHSENLQLLQETLASRIALSSNLSSLVAQKETILNSIKHNNSKLKLLDDFINNLPTPPAPQSTLSTQLSNFHNLTFNLPAPISRKTISNLTLLSWTNSINCAAVVFRYNDSEISFNVDIPANYPIDIPFWTCNDNLSAVQAIHISEILNSTNFKIKLVQFDEPNIDFYISYQMVNLMNCLEAYFKWFINGSDVEEEEATKIAKKMYLLNF